MVAPAAVEQQGEVGFGTAADEGSIDLRTSLGDLRIDWLDRWLRPDRLAPVGKPVRIFVTGVNRWRDEDAWPLARSVDTPLYLREDGGLSSEAPGADERPDTYRYDPADPVVTLGGTLLMSGEFPPGPHDQRRVEERPDVLVYTGEPLDADLEVTGRVRVSLTAASTAPSTDWVARLCDVGVDSVSRNLTDGIVRVSGPAGEPADHEIDLWSIGHVFLKGHRIRVQITSSNFPRWDRNLNTGEPAERATAMRVADQTVFHDAARPSRIILPVVPPEDPAR
ncbi:CocE/NonD family hydrolase [Streptosporangium lutulentum]